MQRVSVLFTAAAFFLALANFSPGASLDLPTLFPMNQHDKWGYIDRTGKIIVPIDRSGKFVWQTLIPCDRWGKPLEQ